VIELSNEQRLFFTERGYIAVRGVYSKRDVELLQNALSELRQRLAAAPFQGGRLVFYNGTSLAETTTPVFRLMWRLHKEFRRHAFNPTIARLAAGLLDTNKLRLITDQVIIKDPQVSGRLNFHQDFSPWEFWPPTQVSCWLALDPVSRNSGAMEYVPGSHHLGERAAVDLATGRRRPHDMRPSVPIDAKEAGYEVVVVELEPGDCVFHHSLTWHGSAPNTTSRTRRAVITRFMAEGTTFRPRGDQPRHVGLVPGEPIEWDDEFPTVWPRSGPVPDAPANH
jgi:ectoine hydroxylase-related dioxygenase (phytanoyl-CoA dioxygenase family)